MATIKEIAKEANVSPGTVSKALNKRKDVSAKTRRRILEIAESHNFVPSASAKNLKLHRTENIGVIFCRESKPLSVNPFYSRVLEGIEGELAINNYNLVLHLLPNTPRGQLPKMIREKQVDGVILAGVVQDKLIERLIEMDIKTVLVDPNIYLEDMSQVLIENEQGALIAIQHLIDKGHRRIAFISGDLDRLSFIQRLNGYKKALERNGIEFEEALLRTGGLEDGYNQVRNLLIEEKPTAVFSTNDLNALLAYNAITDMGYRIPDDVSIVGYDDIWSAKMAKPPLTTIRVYKEELGSIGVRALLRMINGEQKKPVQIIMPVKLIIRASVKEI